MTTLLAIETSSTACSVALKHGTDVIEDHRIVPRQHNALVLTMIDGLFAAAGIAPGTLEAVVFGRGPGSFTGVRIAAAIAQGLSLATDARVVSMSSLESMARDVLGRETAAGAIATLPSRPGELYLGMFKTAGDDIVPSGDEQVGAVSDVQLPEGDASSWVVVGEPAPELARRWVEGGPRIVNDIYPRASAMLTRAEQLLDSGEPVRDRVAVPIYLQAGEPWRKRRE